MTAARTAASRGRSYAGLQKSRKRSLHLIPGLTFKINDLELASLPFLFAMPSLRSLRHIPIFDMHTRKCFQWPSGLKGFTVRQHGCGSLHESGRYNKYNLEVREQREDEHGGVFLSSTLRLQALPGNAGCNNRRNIGLQGLRSAQGRLRMHPRHKWKMLKRTPKY